MKRISVSLSALILSGCTIKPAIVKNYLRLEDSEVNSTSLIRYNLNEFDFYKREVYFNADTETGQMYKGPKRANPDDKLYEIQFVLIEKGTDPRRIIVVNYIPPYTFNDNLIYNYPLYTDNYNLFNVNAINYIMFGNLNDGEATFRKKRSTSIWRIAIDGNTVTIPEVTFRDRGVTKSVMPQNVLSTLPTYTRVDKPLIVLHQDVELPINTCNTDNVAGNTLYVDTNSCSQLLIQFTEPIDKHHTWIKFPKSRTRAY